MANIDFTKTSYSDTTAHKRAITDYVSLISPTDTPLLAYFGIQSKSKKFNVANWPSTAVEWLQDELLPRADSLNGSIASTTTTVTVADASVFAVGDVVEIDSEYLYVTARSTSAETITVTRAQGGTTAASHADTTAVTRITNARLEGAANDVGSAFDITAGTNYTQIIHKSIKISRTQQKLSQYGIDDEYEMQIAKKVKEANIELENALIKGKLSAGSGTTQRMLGGLGYFINSSGGNTVSAGGAVTQADFEDAMELCYADGSMPSVAFVSPANMQVVKNFYDSSSFLRVPRDETTVGMTVQRVVTPFGELDLVMDRWMPSSAIYLVNPDHFEVVALDPFFAEELAKDGDYMTGAVVGEFTCLIRHPLKAHGAIIAIS